MNCIHYCLINNLLELKSTFAVPNITDNITVIQDFVYLFFVIIRRFMKNCTLPKTTSNKPITTKQLEGNNTN